jgi:drug/metabolite transporter (DMT)-like permease
VHGLVIAAVVTGAGAPVALLIGVGLQLVPVAHAGALYQGVVPLAVACVVSITLGERINTLGKVGLCLVLM